MLYPHLRCAALEQDWQTFQAQFEEKPSLRTLSRHNSGASQIRLASVGSEGASSDQLDHDVLRQYANPLYLR